MLFALFLIIVLTIVYLFGSEFEDEVDDRCSNFSVATASNSVLYPSIDNCAQKIRDQMRWQIIGLAVVFIIGALFAINIVRKVSAVVKEHLDNEIRMEMEMHEYVSDFNFDEEKKSDDEEYERFPISN